jgi:hypothetical protein
MKINPKHGGNTLKSGRRGNGIFLISQMHRSCQNRNPSFRWKKCRYHFDIITLGKKAEGRKRVVDLTTGQEIGLLRLARTHISLPPQRLPAVS